MKNLFLLVLITILFKIGLSQNTLWYLTRGLTSDEVAWAVDTDEEGNIYWAIEQKDQWPYWYYNIAAFKISSEGEQVWQSASWDNGTGFNDIAFVAKIKNDNLYLAGRTDSSGFPTSGDALLMCYNKNNGELNWAKNLTQNPDFGYQEIDGINIESDGIYLTGWTNGATTDMDFFILKTDFSGNTVWINSWDYNSLGRFDGANGHMVMDNNFIYTVGSINRSNISSLDGDGTLVCFSRANGAYQWHVEWDGGLYDDALGMTMSADSMLYTIGYLGTMNSGSQIMIRKYNRSGQLQWFKEWGNTGTEDTRAIVADGDSIIYAVGTTSSYGQGAKDIFVLKLDAHGNIIDSLFWGGAFDETAQDVAIHDGILYISGETRSFGNGQTNGTYSVDALLLNINGRAMQAPDTLMTDINSDIVFQNEQISIFPNPFDATTTISISEASRASAPDKKQLKIFDITGKLVFEDIYESNTYLLNRGTLERGVYFVEVAVDLSGTSTSSMSDRVKIYRGKLIVK